MKRGLHHAVALLTTWTLVTASLTLNAEDVADARGEPDLSQQVTRSGFTMAFPSWSVDTDDDLGATGRYVRTDGLKRAEVSWYLYEGSDIAPFDASLKALQEGYGMVVVERRAYPDAEAPRLEALLDYAGRGWIAMTQIACAQAGVGVTVSVASPTRAESETLSEKVLDTFTCRSADLPRLVETWPDSDLPGSFGLYQDGSPILVNADGRWVMITRLAHDTVRSMSTNLERARSTLAGLGAAIGDTWTLGGTGRETQNLSGTSTTWVLGSTARGVVAANAFACKDGSAFVVLAGNDNAASDAAALADLTVHFGCPGASDAPPLTERQSACDAGVTDFCEAP